MQLDVGLIELHVTNTLGTDTLPLQYQAHVPIAPLQWEWLCTFTAAKQTTRSLPNQKHATLTSCVPDGELSTMLFTVASTVQFS